jgi:DNA-binding transcriptional MerR regulator
MSKLLNISQVSKTVNLTDSRNNKPLNYILRFWEKEFKQIRPKKINNRRYYTKEQVEIIKLIKFLLKTKGMTISGVKNLLNLKINKLDDINSYSLKAEYYKNSFKEKSKKILDKIKKLKKYGKKNSPKS